MTILLSALTLTSADRALPEDVEGPRILGESGEMG